MSPKKVLKVMRYYAWILEGLGCPPEQMPTSCYGSASVPNETMMRHLAWMASEVAEGRVRATSRKAHRWIGYIQGELRAAGTFTVDELREHSRPREDEDRVPEWVDLATDKLLEGL